MSTVNIIMNKWPGFGVGLGGAVRKGRTMDMFAELDN